MEGYETPSATHQEGKRFSCVAGSLCEGRGALLDQLKERVITPFYGGGLLMVLLQMGKLGTRAKAAASSPRSLAWRKNST